MPKTFKILDITKWAKPLPCVSKEYQERKEKGLESEGISEECLSKSVIWRATKMKFGVEHDISLTDLLSIEGIRLCDILIAEENVPGFTEQVDTLKLSVYLFKRLKSVLAHPVVDDLVQAYETQDKNLAQECFLKFKELCDLFGHNKLGEVSRYGKIISEILLQDDVELPFYICVQISSKLIDPLWEGNNQIPITPEAQKEVQEQKELILEAI